MADGDKKPPEKSDDESPAPGKPDERVSSHDDMGVRVSRDLRATGPTARGYNSNMSKLNFSSRGLPRDEIAEEEPVLVKPAAAVPVHAPAASAAPVAAPAAPAAPAPGGVLSWLAELFTHR